MIYSRLALISVVMFLALSLTNLLVHSSGTMPVGKAKCELYTEQSGIHCARVYCDATGATLSGFDTCTPTDPLSQSDFTCENLSNCTLNQPVECNKDQKSAEYARTCDGNVQTISTRQ